jgi:hypothetical protein
MWREVREDFGRFFVPEGRCDRSLARSAWERVPPKNRPVGYGMIGIPEIFLVEMCPVFLSEGESSS